MPICPTCKVSYIDGESHICGEDRKWPTRSPSREAALQRVVTRSDAANALSGRYRDGYREGKFIAGFGQFVKIAGAVLGAIVAVAGMLSYQAAGAFGGSLAVSSVIAGGVVALTFFVLGVIISAQGQLLLAALDTAVNSSPFLTDDQRSQILF